MDLEKYLRPTSIIDSDHEEILVFAYDVIKDDGEGPVDKAVKLYYAVRDGIWYDPYYPFYLPEHYRASNVLRSGRGYCVCKASLLCALGRACGIPSRIGFADVRNHLATKQLIDHLGSDIFVYHGFTEFHLKGKWVKATPAFNVELCKKHGVLPLEFNGREDSLFHEYNQEKKLFMQYIRYHPSYHDIPVETIVRAWEEAYGKDRVRKWIENCERSGGKTIRDFYEEEVLSP
ncbi:MAG: transglutaminase domain-containing protein [Deltaproteobacteria bacterium]|nr:transglutaminase domain-containing protein [Deltaproteobacteria bacterium]